MIWDKNTLIFEGRSLRNSVLTEKVLSSQTNFYQQMADLKEETTVDNTNTAEETVAGKTKSIDPSMEGIQLFYEKNKKMVTYVGGAAVVLIAALIYFKAFYLPEQESEAANQMFWAESYFEKDSFALALKGGNMVNTVEGLQPMKGFESIADEYGMTTQGNLANFYAGICHLRTGNFEQAVEWLNKYDGSDDILAPIAIGATGDAHMELNHFNDAYKFYMKAADKSNNNFTSPYFLKKAALALELNKSFSESAEVLERLRTEFPRSAEAQEAAKEVARLRAMSGQ
jgi:tetratricopeptide (TPR) repeat protein